MGSTHLLRLVFVVFKIWIAVIDATDELCNVTSTAQVDYEFNSDVVAGEHIITFNGFFARSTRKNYVSAALKNAGVSIYIYHLFFNSIQMK